MDSTEERADPAPVTRPEKIQLDTLRSALDRWFAERRVRHVEFRENLQPGEDDSASYTVCYEATFEPSALDQGFVEIWGTTQGDTGVGFERRTRIAQRLNTKAARPERFVAGHEPSPLALRGLLAVLNAIADGRIAVLATVLPWLGLTSARAVTTPPTLDALRESGNPWLRWLHARPKREPTRPHALLAFRPWQ